MKTNKQIILTSGTYETNNLDTSNLTIGKGQNVTIFDYGNNDKLINISIENNSKIFFYGFYDSAQIRTIKLNQLGNESNSQVKILNLCKKSQFEINADILMNCNNSIGEINILNICNELGKIKSKTLIDIKENTYGCSANILQENIFIGDSGKITGIPALKIATNEAKASHSLKIEKIDKKDLFYLESHGIDDIYAKKMLLESKIINLFGEYYDDKIILSFKNFFKID